MYVRIEGKKNLYTPQNPQLIFFFVVEEIEDGVWEQITVPLKTFEEAKAYKDRWNGKHPNAFIVASLNEA
jgi:hypothetical protein